MKTDKTVQLLSDVPASKDAFGSHKKVADAIAALIRSEPGGRTIGIEGTWGSGKSTVVNLLSKNLEANVLVCVAIFDAWAHQGDPLRRSFLESMVIALKKKGWLTKYEAKWRHKIDELSRRHKTSTRRATPILSGFGQLMGIALSLFPLGIPLVTLGEENAVAIAVGSLFLIGPLLVLVLNGILRHGADIWALFVQTSVVEETTVTAETPDPTSIEFKHYFYELMTDCLSDFKKSLVIVVDNLDRIPADDAKSIWSVLRVFLDHAGHEPPPWHDRLWIIVPFDASGIRQQLNIGSENNSDTSLTASNFLDKAVQVSFYVAPPLLSNWQNFLADCLRQAFPQHDPSSLDFHRIYRLYATTRANHGRNPTPRDLITYTNAIGALYRQWGESLPLAHMAYYVILRQTNARDIPVGLLNGTIPAIDSASLLGESILDDLAALHFNTEPDLARQVLLRGPILESLTTHDTTRLIDLAKGHRGFYHALENELQILVPSWTKSESQSFARASDCIVSSTVLETAPPGARYEIIRTLELGVKAIDVWQPFNEETAKGIVSLIKVSKDEAIIDALINSVTTSGQKSKDVDSKDLVAWTKGCIGIAAALQMRGRKAPSAPPFCVPTTPEDWTFVCEVLWETDPSNQTWGWMRPSKEWTSVTDALIKAANSDQFKRRHLRSTQVGTSTSSAINWEQLAATIEARLVQNVSYDGEGIQVLFRTLLAIEPFTNQKQQRLANLARQGHILSYAHHAWNAASDESIALTAVLHLREFPNGGVQGSIHHSAAGLTNLTSLFANPQSKPKVVEFFISILAESNLHILISALMNAGAIHANWLRACIETILTKGATTEMLGLEVLEKQWSYIRNTLDNGKKVGGLLDRIVSDLLKDPKTILDLKSKPFNPLTAWLYASIVRAEVHDIKSFSEWCEAGLQEIDKSQWIEEFNQHGDLLQLLIDLSHNGLSPRLELPYVDALSEQSQRLVLEGKNVTPLASHWKYLKEPVRGYRLSKLKQSLLDHAKNADGKISEDFFEICGEDMADLDLLKKDRRIVDSLFSRLIDEGHSSGIAWLAALFHQHGNFLEDYEPTFAIEEFQDRIKSALKNAAVDDKAEAVKEIAAKIGLMSEIDQGDDSSKTGSKRI